MDVGINSFIEYLEDIGMGLEIRAYPISKYSNVKAEILLRI